MSFDEDSRNDEPIDREEWEAAMKTENDGAGAPAKVRMGFHVEIKLHTKDAEKRINSPEWLRNRIGEMSDNYAIDEEVDYTLEVKRTHEQV
jgi:hypothetical protein